MRSSWSPSTRTWPRSWRSASPGRPVVAASTPTKAERRRGGSPGERRSVAREQAGVLEAVGSGGANAAGPSPPEKRNSRSKAEPPDEPDSGPKSSGGTPAAAPRHPARADQRPGDPPRGPRADAGAPPASAGPSPADRPACWRRWGVAVQTPPAPAPRRKGTAEARPSPRQTRFRTEVEWGNPRGGPPSRRGVNESPPPDRSPTGALIRSAN